MAKSKLKKLKKLGNLISEYNAELMNELLKVKKEHNKILLESKSTLISEICKGEGLDELLIKEKYLKSKKTTTVTEDITDSVDSVSSEQLLCHMKLDGKDYFFEDKLNGIVYDSKNKKVGSYSSGTIKLR